MTIAILFMTKHIHRHTGGLEIADFGNVFGRCIHRHTGGLETDVSYPE